MAKSNKKPRKDLNDINSLKDFVEHYLILRFFHWCGDKYWATKKWGVAECCFEDNGTSSKKISRFNNEEDALKFVNLKQTKLREQLCNKFNIEIKEPEPEKEETKAKQSKLVKTKKSKEPVDIDKKEVSDCIPSVDIENFEDFGKTQPY